MWVNVNPQVCRNYKLGNRKDISIKERMTLLQRKDRILYFKPHTRAKSFSSPRLLIFTVRQAKIISHLFCLFLRHLSEMMAYFAALTLSTPRSKTAIIRFHQQLHTQTALDSTSNFSCQSLAQIIFYRSLAAALETSLTESNFYWFKKF